MHRQTPSSVILSEAKNPVVWAAMVHRGILRCAQDDTGQERTAEQATRIRQGESPRRRVTPATWQALQRQQCGGPGNAHNVAGVGAPKIQQSIPRIMVPPDGRGPMDATVMKRRWLKAIAGEILQGQTAVFRIPAAWH